MDTGPVIYAGLGAQKSAIDLPLNPIFATMTDFLCSAFVGCSIFDD
jgi:hypothetical protein